MKPDHVHTLLYKFQLGIIILFEHELINWQTIMDVYFLNINTNINNASVEIPSNS